MMCLLLYIIDPHSRVQNRYKLNGCKLLLFPICFQVGVTDFF